MFDRPRAFLRKYERWASPVTLVFGFIFDSLTLRRIDLFYSNFLLISYLVLSAGSIMLLNFHEHRRMTRGQAERSETIHMLSVFTMQFCLGGLFSASLLFYSRSGSLIASWPFLLMIATYVIGNEALRRNYIRLGFQIGVFFTALFSYLIFFLPVIFGKMGDAMFLLSGIASLMITGVFVYVLSWFAPARTSKSAPMLVLSVGGLFALINILYFTNLMPPIPLVLREAGIFRSIERLPDGTYRTVGEKQEWFHVLSPDPIIHVDPDSTLFALTGVFAPTNLATDIVHEWQRFDTDKGEWTTVSDIGLSITGGREKGFRTFSRMEDVEPGLWRVNVETPRGQLIGRMTFSVATSTGGETLFTDVN
ncbi:MAG TPA: DUF2914 domain-containing protein [Candidatus Paceibacterota bacterium]|nr:DUF2914 domain-containing protein [Candidatus Paceibacterota bacterium]